jgi:excisionase family DNA binding protein
LLSLSTYGGRDVEQSIPAFLRVEEAAAILRISRSAAYEQANAWLATGGEVGLPVIRVGRAMRVPRAAIERLASTGAGDPSAA